MSFKIIVTPYFEKEVKPLSKKYPSIKKELSQLLKELLVNPLMGEPIGKDCYKIRLAIASNGRGKSGGARVITCVKIVASHIFLMSIYDKSEQENIDDSDLKQRLKILK